MSVVTCSVVFSCGIMVTEKFENYANGIYKESQKYIGVRFLLQYICCRLL